MDIPRFVRRLSSYGLDDNSSSNPLASVTPSSSLGASRGAGLTVDTSVAKTQSFRTTPTLTTPLGSYSREPTPSSTRSSLAGDNNEEERTLRRRRSNSECLMLAKNNGTQDLPGPCKEYISSVKQILARSSEESRPAARRRSMSMRNNPATIINEGVLH